MNRGQVTLNPAGVRALLRSEEMRAICEEHATATLKGCGKGYEMGSFTGKNRVNAQVWAATARAKRDNLKNNTLLKALR